MILRFKHIDRTVQKVTQGSIYLDFSMQIGAEKYMYLKLYQQKTLDMPFQTDLVISDKLYHYRVIF